MTYILGFIYADGNIMYDETPLKNKYYLRIRLKDDDSERTLLEKIRKELKFTGDLIFEKARYKYKREKKEVNSVGLTLNSKKLVDSLMELGLTPNKSLTKEFPKIPKEYELDFIRGYFDGNGSVSATFPTNSKGYTCKTLQIRIHFSSGSHKFLNSMQEKLQNYRLNHKNISSSKVRENAHTLRYATEESMKLYELFYKNIDTNPIYLESKYKKFTDAVNLRKRLLEEK